MDVAVHAWHWRATFATAKKLPSLAAGTAAILVRRMAEAPERRAKYIEQREGVYRLLRRSGLQIHRFLASCASCRQWGMGWLTYLYEPLA